MNKTLSGRNHPHLKLENRSVVLRVILVNGPISRRDIAGITRLTSAAISNITNALIADGLVIETGADKGQPQGGRRPILLDLNPSGPFVVGVHLGRTRASIGLTDLRGRQFGPRQDLPKQAGMPHPLPVVADAIRQVIAGSGRPMEQALGIGVGVARMMDADGQAVAAADPGSEPAPIKVFFEQALNLPAWAENNVRAIALGEAWVDHESRTGSFVMVYVSNLIGAAIVIADHIHQGFRQAAGQIGHLQVDPNGPLCSCGRRGCLEAVASDMAVFTQATEAAREHPDSLLARLLAGTSNPNEGVLKLVEAALGNDPHALNLLTLRSRNLGKALAMIGTLFDPERIVIAGPTFAEGAGLQLPTIRSVVAAVAPLTTEPLPIVASRLGQGSQIIGAAAVALHRLFAPV